ncbi:MAG: hypothetical protein A2498_08390 [Lentisphaerae bacterium RIFOXYC12_FULL_60_16]|nr:MAG: hypothetical protein A2498_08390 [Lentisphaerae bacterium RIFOXYC12_FULL_60_16]OGV75703.1 MAG: hypothetical protein A2340_12535 [Lentisphaerae bacterium RIFOXYB12_FULL_60_10]
MNLSHSIDSLLFFVSQWAGVALPRILAALLGLIICILVLVRLWEQRSHYVNVFIWGLLGVLLVGMSLDTRILHGLGATSFLVRIRLLIGFMSVGVLLITLESIRRYRLQERYALVWVATAAVILASVCWPRALAVVASVFGLEYVTAVVVVFLVFMILAAFHVSLALSSFQDDRKQLAQRCSLLEARLRDLERGWKAAGLPQPPSEPVTEAPVPAAGFRRPERALVRLLRGTQLAAPLLIVATLLGALVVGWLAPGVMVGDEVTHYHILTHQAEVLPTPTYMASIPNGWGEPELRRYPHPHLWHYLGAMIYRWVPSARAIQFYHLLFLAQLLFVSFLLARDRGGVENRSAFLYVLALATMPALLMFGILLYQDVPVTAQLVTAFYLITRRRPFWATVAMMVALGMKVSAFVMVPPFLAMLAMVAWKSPAGSCPGASGGWLRVVRTTGWTLLSGLLMLSVMGGIQWSLKHYTQGAYYPFEQLSRRVANLSQPNETPPVAPVPEKPAPSVKSAVPGQAAPLAITVRDAYIEANHPGDLRDWRNWLIYGGVIIWPCLVLGLAGWCTGLRKAGGTPVGSAWPLWVGLWYCAGTAFQLWTAPDARFFLPGIPFLLLPFVEHASRLPRFKLLVSLLAAVAILQSVRVLDMTYQLRRVSPALQAAITYLKQKPVEPFRVFMYPEGHYRLFPCQHEWYLGYNLRNFWRADNTLRIRYLQRFKIGAIVVKKRLVAEADSNYTNLGIYPVRFVRDIDADPRFEKLFDNPEVAIYQVPEAATAGVSD